MAKKNRAASEPGYEIYPTDSDNAIENIKFITKLKLQRSVLKKLAGTHLSEPNPEACPDPENPNSN